MQILEAHPVTVAYTKNFRRLTVMNAMLDNLKDPPYPWKIKEVIHGHFRLKAKAIGQLPHKWLEVS